MSDSEDLTDPMASLAHDFAHVVDYVVVAKVMQDDGEIVLAVRTTETMPGWEVVGMLLTASDAWRGSLGVEFSGQDRDDDDDDDDDELAI
jgi:hypothetical protein